MTVIRRVVKEVAGLFIDDGSLALLVLVLIAAITGLVKLAGLPALWGGFALLAGCLAILAESIVRACRRRSG